ncbi:MAG TPA: methylmalonyl-CoA mutase family protein [Caulobacteraceae bacterium]
MLPLAEDFPAPGRAEWLKLVEKALKGGSVDDLVSRTADGIEIQPLYREGQEAVRDLRVRDAERPWEVRMATAHPDAAQANAEVMKDLEGGAASVLVKIDPAGRNGVAVGSADDLARALNGVLLELAPVALDAGYLGPKAADWLGALAKAAPAAPLALHMDPLSTFAETGQSPGPVESHMVSAATVGARLRTTYPRASLMLATGRVVHEAGGTEAQELGFMAAAAVAYAKALRRAGVPMEEAFAALVLGVSVDGQYFLDIAKLRAARALWARITEACEVTGPARIEARSSHRMLAKLDPWTNLIRLTATGFGAAVGGADAIVLGTFTDALGLPTAFARRQARNTQLVLMEEASLGRVADPAGGAWFLDNLTEQLAQAAWAQFQAIEAAGGIVAALGTNLVQDQVAAAREARLAAIAANDEKILGVTVFRNADEKPVEVEQPVAVAVDAPDPRLPGPDGHCAPLRPIRFAAAFEEAN